MSQPQGFTLAWQGLTGSVYIKMSPEFVGHTCGLCGNFNADTQDDLKTSYGKFSPFCYRLWHLKKNCMMERDNISKIKSRLEIEDFIWQYRKTANLLNSKKRNDCTVSTGHFVY